MPRHDPEHCIPHQAGDTVEKQGSGFMEAGVEKIMGKGETTRPHGQACDYDHGAQVYFRTVAVRSAPRRVLYQAAVIRAGQEIARRVAQHVADATARREQLPGAGTEGRK